MPINATPMQDLTSVDLVNRQLYTYRIKRILAECGFPPGLTKLVVTRANSQAIRYLP